MCMRHYKKSPATGEQRLLKHQFGISISEMIEDPLSIKIHFQGAIKTAFWHVLLEKVSADLVDWRFSTPENALDPS